MNEFKIKNGAIISGSITGITEDAADNSAKMASTAWVRTYLANTPSGTVINGTGFVKANGTSISYDNNTYYLASNPSGYITGINSSMVTTALGYTPYNATNPNGYITSASSISGNAATATAAQNATFLTQPNATWGARLQLGGNGSGSGVANIAVVQATDGNIHIDPGVGKVTYLNYYNNGVIYLNGSTYNISSNGSQYNGNSATATTASNVAWGGVTGKPSYIMFYEGFTLDANTMSTNSTGFTYSVNSPFTGPIARISANGSYDLWLGGSYSGGNNFYLRTRNGDAGTFNSWKEIVHSGNIGSQSVNYASSSGNADTVDGYHATNAASGLAYYAANGYLYAPSWIRVDTGIFSSINSAHFLPNDFSHGSWKVLGTRGDWAGLHFGGATGMTLMMNETEFGFYRNQVGWTARFTNNTGHFNISGGAATATTATNALGLGNSGAVSSLSSAGIVSGWDTRPGGNAAYSIGYHTGLTLHGYGGYGGVRLYSAGYPDLSNSVLRLEASSAVYTFGGLFSDGNAVIHAGNIGSQVVAGLNQNNYIVQRGTNGSWTADFQATPAASMTYGGDLGATTTGNPGGTWWMQQNFRHTNATSFWGVQVAWGWEDNANRLATRNVTGGSYGGWVYYINSLNLTSYMDAPNKAGTSYYQANTWIQFNGYYGLYWPNHFGAHFSPNDISSHTQFSLRGSKNGYGGIHDQFSAVSGIMYDSSGNGGVYREANGRWYFYHYLPHNCMGINTSTTSGAYGVYVSGGIYSTGDIVAYSDARKKTNVVTVNNALNTVLDLRGVFYSRIDDDTSKRQIGVIAQETEKVLPEVVTYASDIDEYGVAYGNMGGLFIEAIKELAADNKNLREQINELKKLIS